MGVNRYTGVNWSTTTSTLIHINQGSLIPFLNNVLYGNNIKPDNIMTTCLTLMTSNINDTHVLLAKYL